MGKGAGRNAAGALRNATLVAIGSPLLCNALSQEDEYKLYILSVNHSATTSLIKQKLKGPGGKTNVTESGVQQRGEQGKETSYNVGATSRQNQP